MIVALSVPAVIGATGLVVDLNRGLEQRVVNQRAADMAALGAAMAYKEDGNASVLNPTASDIVRINGVSDAVVTAEIIPDFPNQGDEAVRVDVVTKVPFTLARVLGLSGTYDVSSQAYASLTTAANVATPTRPPYAAPCILALSSASNAILVSGGASIAASNCTVAAVGGINNQGQLIEGHDIVSGSGSITNNYGTLRAQSLRYAGSFNNQSWNTNVPSASVRVNESTTLIDPWANSSVLADARSLLGTPSSNPPALTNPDTATGCSGAVDWSLDWNPGSSHPAKAYWTGSGYTFPAGKYCIKKLTTGGGLNISFANGSQIYIQSGFTNSASSFKFGDSDIFVNGGFNSGSSGVTIGNGKLHIGSGTVSFSGTNRKGNGDVIINATLNMGGGQNLFMGDGKHSFGGITLGGGGNVIMGAGDLTVVNGISVSGGSEVAVNDGNIRIGKASNGRAVNLAGSAKFFMGNGTFSANGDIETEGGSMIVFGETANHFLNGNMHIRGAALFGAGRYTINGNFVNGTGGTTWPYTSTLNGKTYGNTLAGESVAGYDMAGVNVTFVLQGSLNLGGGAKTKLAASTTTVSGAQIADMLLYSETSSSTNWVAGAQNRFGGVVYLPKSAVTMSGGNSTLDAGRCFSLVAYTLSVSGGAATGSTCATIEAAYNGEIEEEDGEGESVTTSGKIKLIK